MLRNHIILLLFLPIIGYAQFKDESKIITVADFSERPVIDGVLDETMWAGLTPASDFWQYFPTDSLLAKAQTEIYMGTDKDNLYIGIKCYGAGNNWLVNSLRRDFRAGGNDNITLIFDTFDDQTNGLFFGINPEGVIREGTISNGRE